MSKSNIQSEHYRGNEGFTLTELLIVIVIVGVLTSLALPAYGPFVAGQRVKSASFDMMAMLTLARSEAIKRNAQVTASPVSGDWSQGWTITAPDGTVLSRQNAISGISITCMQGSPLVAVTCISLSFNANGRSASAQSIQIGSTTTGVNARCIGIDLSGRPNSKKGNC